MAGPVLVTGAGGFAGGHLVEHLSATGANPVAWARSEPPSELTPVAVWDRVDLLDAAVVREKIASLRPAVIYHCAGASHVAESWQDTSLPLAGNVLATHHLLDAVRRAGSPCRLLITGSSNVYATSLEPLTEDSPLAPASPYGLSKLAQEQLGLRAGSEDGLDIVLTRSFNHVGARQNPAFAASGMAKQIALIERGTLEPVIKVGNLDARRDITDVRDTVRAYVLLAEKGAAGAIYNVASGVGRSMREVLEGLVSRARVPVRVETEPARLRPNDVPVLVGDASRLRRSTGWSPAISFDRLLDDLLGYWRGAV